MRRNPHLLFCLVHFECLLISQFLALLAFCSLHIGIDSAEIEIPAHHEKGDDGRCFNLHRATSHPLIRFYDSSYWAKDAKTINSVHLIFIHGAYCLAQTLIYNSKSLQHHTTFTSIDSGKRYVTFSVVANDWRWCIIYILKTKAVILEIEARMVIRLTSITFDIQLDTLNTLCVWITNDIVGYLCIDIEGESKTSERH